MKTILIFKNQKCTLSFKLGNKGVFLLNISFWWGGGGAITRSHHDWVFAMSMILKIGLD